MQHELTHHGSEGHEAARSPRLVRRKAPLVGVIGGVLLALGLAGWTSVRIVGATQKQVAVEAQRSAEAERSRALKEAPVDVEVTTPVARTWEPVLELDGTLFPGQSAELGFESGGRLIRIGARVGERVKAGALLGVLDSSEVSARLAAARAEVRAAEAQLALADDSERRTSSLLATGALAEAAGVQTAQQQALARARLDSARAQVALLEVSLAGHRLVAPFAGSITRAPDGVGGVVNPGDPKFELMDLSTLKLKGTLGEHDAALVAPGSKLEVRTERGVVVGTLTTVLGSVDPATRRVRVEATIDNREPKLRAGSFVRAAVRTGQAIEVLELPPEVLRPGGQDEVLIALGERVASRRITYSVGEGGKLLVRHGVSASDRVVLSPKPELDATRAVRVVTPGEAP